MDNGKDSREGGREGRERRRVRRREMKEGEGGREREGGRGREGEGGREGGREKVLTWGGSTQNGSPSPSWQGQSRCPVS